MKISGNFGLENYACRLGIVQNFVNVTNFSCEPFCAQNVPKPPTHILLGKQGQIKTTQVLTKLPHSLGRRHILN